MHQVEEIPPAVSSNLNGAPLKCEVVEQPLPTSTPISLTESSVAPPSVTQPQMITVPIAPAQPLLTSTPSTTIKRTKRVCTSYLSNRIEYYFLEISNVS